MLLRGVPKDAAASGTRCQPSTTAAGSSTAAIGLRLTLRQIRVAFPSGNAFQDRNRNHAKYKATVLHGSVCLNG
jgi:hypothetical protein